jgi:hypothetical protein
MHMEPIIIQTRRRADRLRYPESGVIMAIFVMVYANAIVRLLFG